MGVGWIGRCGCGGKMKERRKDTGGGKKKPHSQPYTSTQKLPEVEEGEAILLCE